MGFKITPLVPKKKILIKSKIGEEILAAVVAAAIVVVANSFKILIIINLISLPIKTQL